MLHFPDSEVFQNFVDAFPRGALLAHHFGSVDRFEPAKAFLREEGGTRQGFPEANEMSFGGSLRSVTEGARVTVK